MLQPKQAQSSFTGDYGFMSTLRRRVGVTSIFQIIRKTATKRFDAASGEGTGTDDSDAPLEDAARSEREYVRERLREELKREPTNEELDEWLRQHTEGY